MLLPKGFYFFNYAAWAALIPFLPLFYQQAGLNGYQIGLLTGIPPLATVFSGPIWGGLGDYTRQYKRLLIVALVGVLASVFGMLHAHSFAALMPLVVAYAFFMAPVVPMVDHTTVDLLGERKSQYGKQRLWGSIGWGVSAPVVGVVMQRAGLNWGFYGFLAMMFCAMLVISGLPISKTRLGIQFWTSLRDLLAQRQLALFLLIVLVGGTGFAVATNFLFLHLEGIRRQPHSDGHLTVVCHIQRAAGAVPLGLAAEAFWSTQPDLVCAAGLRGAGAGVFIHEDAVAGAADQPAARVDLLADVGIGGVVRDRDRARGDGRHCAEPVCERDVGNGRDVGQPTGRVDVRYDWHSGDVPVDRAERAGVFCADGDFAEKREPLSASEEVTVENVDEIGYNLI